MSNFIAPFFDDWSDMAMPTKLNLSQDDIQTILAAYDVGTLLDFQAISTGTVQSLYRVITSDTQFALKIYSNRSHQSVQFEADTIQHITAKEFPTAKLISQRDGQRIGTHQTLPYILFEWITGVPVEDFTSAQRNAIIQTAARLATITTDFVPSTWRSRWNYSSDLALKLATQNTKELATEAAQSKLVWYQEMVTQIVISDSHPTTVGHCDYDPSNLLFTEDTLTALIDFDDANLTYSTFDLIHLIDLWAWPFGSELDLSVAKDIAHQYQHVRPLTDVEKYHLFDVHQVQILMDGIWFYQRGNAQQWYEKERINDLHQIGRDHYLNAILE